MRCSPLFPSIESAVPTFKDVRAAVARASWQRARATWIPDEHGEVKSTLWSWWITLFRIYVLKHRQIWYERHSTQKDLSFLSMHSTWIDLLLALNSSMISVRNIFVAHPPRDFKRFWNLTLAALGTKKQQEGQIWIGLSYCLFIHSHTRIYMYADESMFKVKWETNIVNQILRLVYIPRRNSMERIGFGCHLFLVD